MNILIIEDEEVAYRNLVRLIEKHMDAPRIVGWRQSVEQSLEWLQNEPPPDLIFLDIQLSDGNAFSIFEQIDIDSPIIFTTAYDEYALKAFELNSIDYLLKPISAVRLQKALDKWQSRNPNPPVQMDRIITAMQQYRPRYKERFLVKKGKQLLSISIHEVAYFFRDEYVFLVSREGKKYSLRFSLEQLEEMLDPHRFFRINRQFILHFDSIQSIHSYFKGKLKIKTLPDPGIPVTVPKDSARAFKDWLDK